MKKIMFMTNGLYGGGAEKVLQTLLQNLDYSKYDVTLYSMHREELKSECYPNKIHYKAVFDAYSGTSYIGHKIYKLLSLVQGKIFQKCSSKVFYRLFIHEKFDVEIAFVEGESTKIISGSNNKSKKIAWVHVDLKANPWTSFLYKGDLDESEHYKKFDQIVCVSDGVKKAFIEKYIIINQVRTGKNFEGRNSFNNSSCV